MVSAIIAVFLMHVYIKLDQFAIFSTWHGGPSEGLSTSKRMEFIEVKELYIDV
jgi:hypothetical protein